jgi:hypothetical protein
MLADCHGIAFVATCDAAKALAAWFKDRDGNTLSLTESRAELGPFCDNEFLAFLCYTPPNFFTERRPVQWPDSIVHLWKYAGRSVWCA